MSPGVAASMADWMVCGGVVVVTSTVGVLPPTVTVTVSIDCWPLG